jgi:ribosomal protein S18 acetylase RimI-like enzyme
MSAIPRTDRRLRISGRGIAATIARSAACVAMRSAKRDRSSIYDPTHNARHRMLLTVKSAATEDEQAVVALWRACDLVASYNDPVADFRFAEAGPSSDVLVAVDDAGEVAGSVMVGHDGHRGWLYYVAARPTSRSKGVGRHMVQAAENWLRQRGIVKVQLLVRETNTKVVSFYEHLGFEVAPRVVMSRWLGKTS